MPVAQLSSRGGNATNLAVMKATLLMRVPKLRTTCAGIALIFDRHDDDDDNNSDASGRAESGGEDFCDVVYRKTTTTIIASALATTLFMKSDR